MKSIYTKAIAAFFGGSGGSAAIQIAFFYLGWIQMDQTALQVAGSSIMVGLVAAITVLRSPANTITPSQVVASAKAGELTKALAGVENRNDAIAVASAVTAPAVAQGMADAGVPIDIIPKPKGA